VQRCRRDRICVGQYWREASRLSFQKIKRSEQARGKPKPALSLWPSTLERVSCNSRRVAVQATAGAADVSGSATMPHNFCGCVHMPFDHFFAAGISGTGGRCCHFHPYFQVARMDPATTYVVPMTCSSVCRRLFKLRPEALQAHQQI
jgi:hypothetical protein